MIGQYFSTRLRASKNDALIMLLLFLATLVLCCMLIVIPGYFSNDELMYMPPASLMHASARFAVADMTTYFYPGTLFHSLVHAQFFRPVGVAILMGVMRSEGLPFVPHLTMVVLHGINCALLYFLFRKESRKFAVVVALLFAVSPLAMYATGWVAAIFDLLVTLFALLMVLSVRSFVATGHRIHLFGSFVFTILAFCSKETAMVIPAIAVLALWPTDYRAIPRRAYLATGTVTLAWLLFMLFRSSALLHAAEGASGGYSVAFGSNIIANLGAYCSYPFVPGTLDVGNFVFLSAFQLSCSIAALVLVFVLTALAVGWRRSVGLALLFLLPLLPVLILTKLQTQYLYASSIALSLALASCLAYGGLLIRLAGLALAALLTVHAVKQQDSMYQTGACQTRLINDIETYDNSSAARDGRKSTPMILPASDAPWWVLANLSTRWDSWNDSAAPTRTDDVDKANLIMTDTCHLVPNTSGRPSLPH